MNRPQSFRSASPVVLIWAVLSLPSPARLAAQGTGDASGDAAVADVPSESVAVPRELAAAADAAEAWLGYLDERDFDEAWIAASSALQVRMSPQSLKASIDPGRRNLGNVVGHTLLGLQVVTDPPNAAPGDYAIFQYRTRDEEGRTLVESVVLRPEDGNWRIAGYFTTRE